MGTNGTLIEKENIHRTTSHTREHVTRHVYLIRARRHTTKHDLVVRQFPALVHAVLLVKDDVARVAVAYRSSHGHPAGAYAGTPVRVFRALACVPRLHCASVCLEYTHQCVAPRLSPRSLQPCPRRPGYIIPWKLVTLPPELHILPKSFFCILSQ